MDRSHTHLPKPPERTTSRLSIPTASYSSSASRLNITTPTLSPLAPRSQFQFSSPPSVVSHSQPVTPLESPQGSSSNVLHAGGVRRLLLPTVRSTRSTNASPQIPSHKPSPAKMSRSRAGSIAAISPSDQTDRLTSAHTPDWIGGGCKFEIVEDQIELEGYQIYAVEKWVVERRRPIIVLTVFTGDPKHKIIATALSPHSSLSPFEAHVEWDKATRLLRTDGARPMEIGKGTLFVTSLANFRSDYTIVHIPLGNFLEVREQLYTNINLLRMGCSGRSALTLEEPSDATKARFISMYHIPDKAASRSGDSFNTSVLELVKLIQASLAIFGMFDLCPDERNGLLCDVTSEGIKRWVSEVGWLCMKVEHMERVADPTVVAALFSLILTIRNKLHALGYYVPKDPFLDPQGFTKALASYHTSKPHAHGHSHSHHLVRAHTSRSASPPGHNATTSLASGAPSNASPVPPLAFLSQQLVESIRLAYNKKVRQTESYKVHKVLINKLDDLAADLRTSSAASAGEADTGETPSSVNPTADLGAFVKVVVGSSKDAPHSLRYLWTGRSDEVAKRRKEKESVWSDVERDERERERDGEKDAAGKDGVEKNGDRDRDMRSSGDESEPLKPWSGRVQRKIESWAAKGRSKKLSVDFGVLGKSLIESPNRGGRSEQSGPSSTVPSVRVTGDDDEPFSSGRTSPTPHKAMLGARPHPLGQPSMSELYDRRISEFDRKRPPYQARITSWSDPVSAKRLVDDEDDDVKDEVYGLTLKVVEVDEDELGMATDTEMENSHSRQIIAPGPRRSKSFDNVASMRGMRTLPVERMRIDVELCGQLLVMHRREQHLANVVACLSALTGCISRTNSRLRADHEAARPALDDLRARAQVLHEVESARTRADALTQETNALAYESAQFMVEDLWHMGMQPRRRVLALRERAFGTGRRHPQGVRGAHGRFNRVQRMLDGQERFVDALGRTESEAEEEEGFPGETDLALEEEGEDIDAEENLSQTLRPTWLLRFFNYWGTKWGTSKGADKQPDPPKDSKEEVPESATSTSLPTSPGVQSRSRPATKQVTTL